MQDSINQNSIGSCNNKLIFSDLFLDYVNFKKIKFKYQSYIKMYNKFNNHIMPYFKDFNIYDINHHIVLKWMDEIEEKGFSYNYKSSIYFSLVNILDYAVNFYNLQENVALKIGNFSKKNKKRNSIEIWTYEEFKKFDSVVDDELYKLFYETLFFTGIRQGECIALTWQDYKDNVISINKTISKTKLNGNYVINSPKTPNSYRDIMLDYDLKKSFDNLYLKNKKLLNFSDKWFIFGGLKPLSPTTIGVKKDLYCKLADVKKIRIHGLRHSHATLLLTQNVPINVISQRLGHSSIYTTLDTYSHFIPKDEEKAIVVINNLNAISSH